MTQEQTTTNVTTSIEMMSIVLLKHRNPQFCCEYTHTQSVQVSSLANRGMKNEITGKITQKKKAHL